MRVMKNHVITKLTVFILKIYVFSVLDVFHIGKRIGAFIHWEPIFIGTNFDPMYDERLSWEGKSDKMTQVNIIKINIKYRSIIIHQIIHILGLRFVCAGLRLHDPEQRFPSAQARHQNLDKRRSSGSISS